MCARNVLSKKCSVRLLLILIIRTTPYDGISRNEFMLDFFLVHSFKLNDRLAISLERMCRIISVSIISIVIEQFCKHSSNIWCWKYRSKVILLSYLETYWFSNRDKEMEKKCYYPCVCMYSMLVHHRLWRFSILLCFLFSILKPRENNNLHETNIDPSNTITRY